MWIDEGNPQLTFDYRGFLASTHATFAAKFRDIAFGWMYRVSYLRKEMALTISGLKRNMFTAFSVMDISERGLDIK